MTKQQHAGTPLQSRPIPGFPGWSVSTDGSVTHCATGLRKFIRQVPNSRHSTVGAFDQLAQAATAALNQILFSPADLCLALNSGKTPR